MMLIIILLIIVKAFITFSRKLPYHQSSIVSAKFQAAAARLTSKTLHANNKEKRINEESLIESVSLAQNTEKNHKNRISLMDVGESQVLIHLFARSSKGGAMWIFYKDFLIDFVSKDLIVDILNGGVTGEICRTQLTSILSEHYLGKGLGIPQIFQNIMIELSPMRKVKIKNIELGYQFDGDSDIFRLDRPQIWTSLDTRFNFEEVHPSIVPVALRLSSAISQRKRSWSIIREYLYSKGLNSIANAIQIFANCSSNLDKLLVASDGSATFISNNTMLISSAGTFIVPFSSTKRSLTSSYTITSNVSIVNFSPDKANLDWDYSDFNDCSLAFKLTSSTGIAITPSDSELLGGILGTTLSLLIAGCRGSSGLNTSISLISDSKSLCRSSRRGVVSTDESSENSRNKLVSLLSALQSADKSMDLQYMWVPGHPERRSEIVETWSFFDQCIWAADEIASSHTDMVSRDNLQRDIVRNNFAKRYNGFLVRNITISLSISELMYLANYFIEK